MLQSLYLDGILRWYEEQLITPGDPSEGKWEEAHTPLPRGMGDATVLLLKEHHFIHDLWQSKELGDGLFFPGDIKELYRSGWWPSGWFDLCEVAEKYKGSPGSKGGSAGKGKSLSEEQKTLLKKIKTGSSPKWTGNYPKMARIGSSTCPVCGDTFVNKGCMTSHLKRVH